MGSGVAVCRRVTEKWEDLTPSRSSPTLSLRKERVRTIYRGGDVSLLFCPNYPHPLLNKERVGEERDGVRFYWGEVA